METLLFAAIWLGSALFSQGGGWNQNARFAQVRAVVEEGRLDIDDFLVYQRPTSGEPGPLVRARVENGSFRIGEERIALAWQDATGSLVPVGGTVPPGARLAPLFITAATADLSFFRGHLYPNKAPGTLAAAVPPYFLLHHVESWFGLDPDDWRVLTANAWLTTALGVSLWAALGGIVFHRLARRLWHVEPPVALSATAILAWGTLYWPLGTLLQEVDLAAAALLMAFAMLLPKGEDAELTSGRAALAGIFCACAATFSYASFPSTLCVGLYAAVRRGTRILPAFLLGFSAALLPLAAYHTVCFGGPFATPYVREHPAFASGEGLFGVIGAPRLDRLLMLLFSPFRGLLFGSPVLIVALPAAVAAWRRGVRRAEILLCSGIFAAFLLVTASFNGWDGGWTSGPRYLVPALPFAALFLPIALRRWRRVTLALAALSVLLQALPTAVDPQPPLDSLSARPPVWLRSPLGEHVLPLLAGGRSRIYPDAYVQPVSANPIGISEGWFGVVFEPGSEETRWSSFNAGELLFPGSRWSLLVVALLVLPCFLVARRISLRSRAAPGPPRHPLR